MLRFFAPRERLTRRSVRRNPFGVCVVLGTALLLLAFDPASAERKPKMPVLREAPQGPKTPARTRASGDRNPYIGSIIFVRGSQVVAEIPSGAQKEEQVIVFDARFRRSGKAAVVRALDKGTYLLRPVGGLRVSPGYRLARESESEAAARVIRENELDSYRTFLAVFPRSAHRPRIAREMFRLVMQSSYPVFPGSVVEGTVRLTEPVSRQLSLGGAQIVLDRFVIVETDVGGSFRIEGIPKLDESVSLRVRVKDARFQMAQPVAVDLRAGRPKEVRADLPVTITPTILEGQVIAAGSGPLPGAEVWTWPYTMEVLTDEEGGYQISRRKRFETSGALSTTDEPMFGDEYEVYARSKGYSIERVTVGAESYRDNRVPEIRLRSQDPRKEELPEIALDLRAHIMFDAKTILVPGGPGPMINR
jgi:hypothetical protein